MRRATDYFENNIGGLNVLEYALMEQVKKAGLVIAYLEKVEDLTNFLRAQSEISNVSVCHRYYQAAE